MHICLWIFKLLPLTKYNNIGCTLKGKKVPGWDEDATNPIIFDDAAHGCHPFPLSWVGSVVILRQE